MASCYDASVAEVAEVAAANVSKTASALVGRQLPGDHWDAVHSVYAQARSKGAETFDLLLLWEFHKAVNVHKWAEGRRAQWRLKQPGRFERVGAFEE